MLSRGDKVKVLDRLCTALKRHDVVVYIDDNEEFRQKVLRKLSEFLNYSNVRTMYIDFIKLSRSFVEQDNAVLSVLEEELLVGGVQVVIFDNFEICLYMSKTRPRFCALLQDLKSQRRKVLLASGSEVLLDRQILDLVCSCVGTVHIMRRVTKSVRLKFKLALPVGKRFKFIAEDEDNSVIVL